MFMTTIVGMSGSNERGSLRIFRRPPNTNVTGRIAAKGMACAALVGFALTGNFARQKCRACFHFPGRDRPGVDAEGI
jgi:hypothetical protein